MVNHGMEDRYQYKYIGVNSRLDSVQAAILKVKLKHLDSYNTSRIDAANYYDKCFSDCDQIITPKRADFSTHVFHQYTLIIKNINRDKLSAHLQNLGIPFGVYYPTPLHQQVPYSDDRFKEEYFLVTNMLCKAVLSLPMHTELTTHQMDYISNTILDFINE
jgi:dTDP-4-amino-4,6-dideoxygalactose transaminase